MLRDVGTGLARVLRAGLAAVAAVLRWMLQALVAVVLVFEEWGWRPLAAGLARLARFAAIAAIERAITRLPPYAALAVFAVPSLLLLPLKLIAVYLIAQGHVVSAAALFIGAKVAGTAIVARLFLLTQAQLLQIWWFARLYNIAMPWKEALTAWVRASWIWRYGRIVKARWVRGLKVIGERWRPVLMAARDRARAIGRAMRRRFLQFRNLR